MFRDGSPYLEGEDVAAPAHADLSDVEVLLQDVALSVAFQVTPNNPQYVIKRLLPNDCYKIISGMPSFSERHGIGEVGHLHTPVPKKALLHAIEWNEIVTIDDAAHDDAVACYMSSHIKSKNIQSVAIVPIGRNDVRWLIVLDKVPPSGKGFSLRDREHLETCKTSTERSLLHLSEEIAEVNNRTLQKALSEYAHLFRNPLTVIGGFARKLKQTRDPERIETYSEIISSQSQRLEEDFCSFMALVGFLFPSRHQRVRDRLDRYLQYFLTDPQFQFLGDLQLLGCEILVVPEAVQALFEEFRKYLRCSSGSGESILIEVKKDPTHAAVIFYSTAFQAFKEDKDVRLAIFRQVAYQLEGDFRMGKGWCQITLPLLEPQPL
jgi:hypothetical protein